MWSCFDNEKEGRQYRQAGPEQIGIIKTAELLCNASAYHQSDTDTYVPAGQIGGGRCPALTVGGQIHEQGIECREHRTEGYSL